ncbi:Putative protein kinase-like domain superfamily [Colletotrichum destructivum]|uniref:Uncharacterized protein n=1 Tax=Colletotrichum destructivum TaxID=34406 RepID=A0AAX4ICZ7_9PEZI|nr:Putative protein kinase-like domain superfamily [Colletotrichum destructivum]
MTEAAPPYDVLFLDRSQNQSNPLPTQNDIDGSEGLVIKFGVHVHPIEGHNMLYVGKLTTVPVPKPYVIYQHRKQQKVITYIVMQDVAGTTLVDLWGGLDHARKTAIVMTLRTYFDQLRQLPHPGYFGNIEG